MVNGSQQWHMYPPQDVRRLYSTSKSWFPSKYIAPCPCRVMPQDSINENSHLNTLHITHLGHIDTARTLHIRYICA